MNLPIRKDAPKAITVAVGDKVRGYTITSINATSSSSVHATVVTCAAVDDVGDVHFLRYDGRDWSDL